MGPHRIGGIVDRDDPDIGTGGDRAGVRADSETFDRVFVGCHDGNRPAVVPQAQYPVAPDAGEPARGKGGHPVADPTMGMGERLHRPERRNRRQCCRAGRADAEDAGCVGGEPLDGIAVERNHGDQLDAAPTAFRAE